MPAGSACNCRTFLKSRVIELRARSAAALGAAPAGRYAGSARDAYSASCDHRFRPWENNVWRGDFDIQLFDAPTRRRYRLETLRFGDLVAVLDSDTRYGAAWRGGRMTIGVVVHSDSTVADTVPA